MWLQAVIWRDLESIMLHGITRCVTCRTIPFVHGFHNRKIHGGGTVVAAEGQVEGRMGTDC